MAGWNSHSLGPWYSVSASRVNGSLLKDDLVFVILPIKKVLNLLANSFGEILASCGRVEDFSLSSKDLQTFESSFWELPQSAMDLE